MRIENNIGWTDATINAATGCDKVSPGCKFCYAEVGTRARVLRAQGIETWGPNGVRQPVNFEPVFRRLNNLCLCDLCHEAYPVGFIQANPAGIFDECRCGGQLRRIRLFADSNSDWLDPKWPVETLAKFLDAIRLAPNVTVQLLTKRIELWHERLLAVEMHYAKLGLGNEDAFVFVDDWLSGEPPSNVWLGVSVEDNKRRERIGQLIQTPAAVRFLSVEPLLEAFPSDWILPNDRKAAYVDWVIVGGESGHDRRDCGVEAIESVVLQCANAGVPVYCKQDSHFKSGQKGRLSDNAWSFKQFPK